MCGYKKNQTGLRNVSINAPIADFIPNLFN